MADCNSVSTPVDLGKKLTKNLSPTSDEERLEMSKVPYQEAIGCLLFLAQGTRPDITFAVNDASRYNNNPGLLHWNAVKRIFRYLKGTLDKKLVYSKVDTSFHGFTDADWASNPGDRRSYTGYVFMKSNGAICWNSKKQQTVALSSTEAEYMAISAATQEALWLIQLENEFWKRNAPTIIFCDNRSTICLGKNDAYQPRTKHIDIRHHFIRQKVNDKQITLTPMSTTEMTADILTKGLPKAKHQFCCQKLGLK